MNHDFKELILVFNEGKVEYLIVGAHALAAYGHVRATKDLDVWIRPELENAERVLQALQRFGAPLSDVVVEDFVQEGTVFQIGLAPLRIDLLTTIDGVTFAEAWTERFVAKFGDVPAFILSQRHLIANKKATGRLQDLADVEMLERINNQ